MNIFIETLSLYGRERDEEIYRVSDVSMLPNGLKIEDVGFTGRQTNEAPTKYIIWSLAQKKQVLDRIYIINTKETIGLELSHLGITTYVFYCKQIIEYIDLLAQENDFLRDFLQTHYSSYNTDLYHSSAEAYFYDVTRSNVVSENRLTAEWKELTDSIFEDDNIDLYFDFTGGSRISSLISMFTLRIAEIKEAKLKQVIYSDITTTPPKLVDCTSTYSIFHEIENVEKAQGTEKQVSIEHEVGKRLGWVSENETKNTQLYDNALAESSTSIKKKTQDDIKQLEKTAAMDMESSSGFSKISISTSLEKTKKNNKQSPFLTLLNKVGTNSSRDVLKKIGTDQIERLIVRFYEEIIDAFCEINVMKYHAKDLRIGKNRKESIAFVIRANSDYYYRTSVNKKTKKLMKFGLIPVVQRWLKELIHDPCLDPVSVMNSHYSITDPCYQGRLDRSFYSLGVTKALNDEFISYLRSQNLYLGDDAHMVQNGKGQTLLDVFEEISSLQRIYFNYGFPFRFVCQSKLLPQIEEYYHRLVCSLMEELSNLKKTNAMKYQRRLKDLAFNDDVIEKAIPILTESEEVWTVDHSMISGLNKDIFIQTLSERMEQVRPFRNAIAHQVTSPESPFREREHQNEIVSLIVEWLLEYDKEFT